MAVALSNKIAGGGIFNLSCSMEVFSCPCIVLFSKDDPPSRIFLPPYKQPLRPGSDAELFMSRT